MNPRQLQRMMDQMGIKNREIKASRVVIECDGEDVVIDSPQVMEIEMQGQRSYQISGNASVKAKATPEDAKLVAEQAGVSEEQARKALEECNGDMAGAILKLKG